jgi:hypothetical protein
MMLHSDGGSVKNKKRYYKHSDGIMEEKKSPAQTMEANVFTASIMAV